MEMYIDWPADATNAANVIRRASSVRRLFRHDIAALSFPPRDPRNMRASGKFVFRNGPKKKGPRNSRVSGGLRGRIRGDGELVWLAISLSTRRGRQPPH